MFELCPNSKLQTTSFEGKVIVSFIKSVEIINNNNDNGNYAAVESC